MEVLKISTLFENMSSYIKKAQNGAVFLYPTDTIYGLGGIVNTSVIKTIDQIKQRPAGKFYSIIAPSFGWIEANFEVGKDFQAQRERYREAHGPLTLLLPLKDSKELVGVRMIDHQMQQFVTQLAEPFITTSANISGMPSITHLDQLTSQQKKHIDFAIDTGELKGSGSTIINWKTGKKIR